MEIGVGDNLMIKNVSYIRARDPSILAFNGADLAQVRTNLKSDLRKTSSEETKQSENIEVYLRIKNGDDFKNLYTISDDTLICNVPEGSQCMRNVKEGDSLKKMFTFTRIFGPDTTQDEIFNSAVKKKILDFINGQNSTILTYGASGSGKTFTVIGTDKEPGIIPRSLEYLFRTLPQLSTQPVAKPLPSGEVTLLKDSDWRIETNIRKNLLNSSSPMDKAHHAKTYTAMQRRLSDEPAALLEEYSGVSLAIWVSFAEIYNEQIYDLLQSEPPRGKPRTRLRLGCSNGNIYIKNLTHINVSSGIEAYQILQYGIHNLNYASTDLNSHSSRSHSIFTIKLVQISHSDGGIHISNFNFCDLAGSERTKKTHNIGDRLKESNNINSSLLVLGRCISAIRNCQKQNDAKLVPFRESKLTQLFQKALAGHEDIAMIVNINSKRDMFDETQHVLNFSAIAKDIAIDRPPIDTVVTKKQNRFSLLVQNKREQYHNGYITDLEDNVEELRNALIFLQDELEQQRNEFEVNVKLNRDYLIQGYEKIIKEMEANADRRVKDAEAYITLKYENRFHNLKAKYDRQLKEVSERNTVIEVEDSDEERVGELKERVDELQEEVMRLQRQVTDLTLDKNVKEQEIEELKAENLQLTEKNMELRKTLDQCANDYIKLERKLDVTETENMLLETQYLKIQNDLDYSYGALNLSSDEDN